MYEFFISNYKKSTKVIKGFEIEWFIEIYSMSGSGKARIIFWEGVNHLLLDLSRVGYLVVFIDFSIHPLEISKSQAKKYYPRLKLGFL